MADVLHKSSLFARPHEISDFVVIIGDQRLNVHKSVLQSTSEYFSALFNSEMIETKTREISLKETLFKPFLIVLKLSYELAITWEEWLDLKVQELCESIVTANRYQFVGPEKQLSQKLIDIFEFRMRESGSQEVDNTCLWEVLQMAKLHNLNDLFLMCLEFFDQNIDYAKSTFDKQLICADILLDVIRRDTFGAPEALVFDMVHKWIQKQRNYTNMKSVEEQLLLESVRLNLLSFEDLKKVSKAEVYDPDVIERYLKHDLGPDLALNQRICYEANKVRKADCHSDIQLKGEHIVVICINCLLSMKSKINHIMFNIKPIDGSLLLDATYWIGIDDSQAENGFRKIVDYTHHSCVGQQDLYFETPFVTRSLRILIECTPRSPPVVIHPDPLMDGQDEMAAGPAPAPVAAPPTPPTPPQVSISSRGREFRIEQLRRARDEWRRRSFRNRTHGGHSTRLLSVPSLEYEFSKSPQKTFNGCVIPEENVCIKFGASCHSPYFGYQFIPLLTDSVLNNDTLTRTEPPPDDFSLLWQSLDEPADNWRQPIAHREVSTKTFQRCLQRPIRLAEQTHHYLIRLTQPVAVTCLQFELIVEQEKTRNSDACLAAECKVELCRSYSQDMSGAEWSVVANDTYLQESGFYNLEFDLQVVSVIKISGFRYNCDKTTKYALHLKNFSIPADRQSWAWTSGCKLRLEPSQE